MKNVSPEELVGFVRAREDMRLLTLSRRRPFTVGTAGDGLEFIPWTKKPRFHGNKWLARVCRRFNRDNSLRPGNYRDLTANASYQLAVIDAYLKRDILPK
jgi:hypothetical protein